MTFAIDKLRGQHIDIYYGIPIHLGAFDPVEIAVIR